MTFDEYWDYPKIENWLQNFVKENSSWVSLEILGTTDYGRPIFLVTLGENPTETPAMWIDAGTLAAEWTGVISLLYSLEKWADYAKEAKGQKWFQGEYDFCCALYLSRWISGLNGRRSIFFVQHYAHRRKVFFVKD